MIPTSYSARVAIVTKSTASCTSKARMARVTRSGRRGGQKWAYNRDVAAQTVSSPLGLRDYASSHSWLRFELNLREAGPKFWMLLGEALSKCEHIAFVPLDEQTAERLHNFEFARGVLATTAIEGNTLSLDEVRQRMAGQLELPTSKEYLGIEVDNMLHAYNGIVSTLRKGDPMSFDVGQLRELNLQILANLDVDDGVVPGEVRQHGVAVGSYLAPKAIDAEYLLERLCEWLNGPQFVAPDVKQRIPFAFIRAVVAHVYIEWIHPFGDGNGRLGRLAEFMVLVGSGVPTPAAHLLSQHYMHTRTQYYRELSRASRQHDGDLVPFLLYAAQGWVDGLVEQIKELHGQQEKLMWRALVDEEFHERQTPAAHRQRILAIELANHKTVSIADIRRLTAPIADGYSGKTAKTLTRDLNRLKEMGFVRWGAKGVRARIEKVRGMRPFVSEPGAI
jgi:Fic family protein